MIHTKTHEARNGVREEKQNDCNTNTLVDILGKVCLIALLPEQTATVYAHRTLPNEWRITSFLVKEP